MKEKKSSIFSFNILGKSFQRNFLIFSIVVVALECFVLAYTIQDNLKRPTIQNLGKTGLIKFSQAKTSKEKKSIFNLYMKDSIYLWPLNGIEIAPLKNLYYKVEFILKRDFGDEYKNLPQYEKDFFRKKTIPFIENHISVNRNESLFKKEWSLYLNNKNSLEENIIASNKFVGLTRYSWNGYKKNMLFYLYKNKLYFASISDVADKMSFLVSILIPIIALILSAFLLIYLNYYFSLKKQNEINKEVKKLLNITQEKNVLLDNQKKNLNNLLENLGQGFMIFNQDGIVQEGATLASKIMFQCEPEGKNIDHVLRLTNEEKETFKKWRKNVWKGLITFNDLLALAPKEFKKIEDQVIQLEFRAIYQNKKVEKVVCVANDITKEVILLNKIQKDREDVQFIKLCISDPLNFIDLMNDTNEVFLEPLFKNIQPKNKELIFRTFHTLKARYGQFGQHQISKFINEMETMISKDLWEDFAK